MPRIAFLSRGHGFGHAARDLQIIEAIRTVSDTVEVVVGSSGTGLKYYTDRSIPCLDLGICDDQDQTLDAARRVLRFMSKIAPVDLVVADEVFSAPTICRGIRVKTLLLTDFFWSEVGNPQLDNRYGDAAGVVLLDAAVTHELPTGLGVPIHITGPLAKKYLTDREDARRMLGVARDALVFTLTFGSPHPGKLPFARHIIGTVLSAWRENADEIDRLFVLAERMPDLDIAGGRHVDDSVRWIGVTIVPEVFYRAADLVVALPGMATLYEIVRNGISLVCFDVELESPDMRRRIKYLESMKCIKRAPLHIRPEQLWHIGERAIQETKDRETCPFDDWAEPEDVARLILSYL